MKKEIMNIAIVGLGSMGCRRLRLLKKNYPQFIIFGVDSNQQRCFKAIKNFKIKTFDSLTDLVAQEAIQAVFVCTSPLSHQVIIKQALKLSCHVFSEINLIATGYDENINLARENNLVLFLSSTPIYREEINFIDQKVKEQTKSVNYSYHIGQYLPDWHPWENYRNFFVSQQKTNACREILAIELPWLIKTFGNIKNFKVVKNKMSDLELNYADNYLLILEHTTGHKGVLMVDIVSRKAVRNLEVFGQNLYLSWQGTPSSLFEYDFVKEEDLPVTFSTEFEHLENYSNFIVENAYLSEIDDFFAVINNQSELKHSFRADEQVLTLIDEIESFK